ncbi:hypothetical protein GSI_14376 [Ganoderma sinense ZZ0214-1]|uniref:Uncharacterized protein n=1 Tax=Ganoderma sinense ZZ0214-1 TaxID=1077348 RepID=A0A2G8RNI0_9APHY|nr:hypothetical protein GSI_14376 [Ganoderma sinense ZZ0214-1]
MDSPHRMKDYMDSPPRIQDYMDLPPVIQDNTDSHPTIQDVMDPPPAFQGDVVGPPVIQGDMIAPRSEFLPIELIEEVIDRASHDPESLRALSLLCKDLLTRARVHLFTGIAIRTVEQMDTSHPLQTS